MPISSETIYYILFSCIIIFIGIIIYEYTSTPSIIGLTIQEAEQKLADSGKKIKLGTKIGFIEPPSTKPQLLGKIAEQIYSKATTSDEYSTLYYKLYQINVDKLFSHQDQL